MIKKLENIQLFAIRQKSTGFYILERAGHRGGYSYSEPEANLDGQMLRFFKSYKSANCALTQWLRGIHESKTTYPTVGYFEVDPDGPETVMTIIPQPHRIKEDMEIVTFTVTELTKYKAPKR